MIRWHTTSNQVVSRFAGEGAYLALDVRPDGLEYAAGGESAAVDVVALGTQERVTALGGGSARLTSLPAHGPTGHTNRVFSVLYHPTDPNVIVTGGWDRTVQIWDTRKSEPIRYVSDVFMCGDGLAIEPKAGVLITGSYRANDSLALWDFATLRRTATLSSSLEQCWFYCCDFSSGGDMILAVGAKNDEARLVDHRTKVAPKPPPFPTKLF